MRPQAPCQQGSDVQERFAPLKSADSPEEVTAGYRRYVLAGG